MELFAIAVNCFCKELHLRCLIGLRIHLCYVKCTGECDFTWSQHCVKSVQYIRKFFLSVFSCIRTRKNSVYGHFSRSLRDRIFRMETHFLWIKTKEKPLKVVTLFYWKKTNEGKMGIPKRRLCSACFILDFENLKL